VLFVEFLFQLIRLGEGRSRGGARSRPSRLEASAARLSASAAARLPASTSARSPRVQPARLQAPGRTPSSRSIIERRHEVRRRWHQGRKFTFAFTFAVTTVTFTLEV
jgi:hypothetical protein